MKNFDRLLTKYLSDFLPNQREASGNTIESYCTVFRQFISYCRDVEQIPLSKLDFPTITDEVVLNFLNWLEHEKNCSVATRNQRLFAIHSFFRYAQDELPQMLIPIGKILSIPKKKGPKATVSYIDKDSMSMIISMPDLSTKSGRRDATPLSLLYDTGARVSEIANLSVRDLRLDNPAKVRLFGKGYKYRDVPIMNQTKELVSSYMDENRLLCREKYDAPLFPNHSGQRMTRAGITYIIKKYSRGFSTVNDTAISPHVFRHTKAMHLLQAGANIVYIRDFLGHVDINAIQFCPQLFLPFPDPIEGFFVGRDFLHSHKLVQPCKDH